MKYRKLRIAWSVTWGLLALSLVLLWVRSYWYLDMLHGKPFIGSRSLGLQSYRGSLELAVVDSVADPGWMHTPMKMEDRVARMVAVWQKDQGLLGFNFDRDPKLRSVTIATPIWFSTGIFVAFAVAPWLRLFNHFSLRTLLIATTLVAVVLGIIGYAVNR